MGEVLPTPWGGFLVTGYEASVQVLRSRDWAVPDAAWKARQGNERWMGYAHRELSSWLMGMNPPQHARHRRSLGNPFSRAGLETMRTTTETVVDRLIGELSERLHDGEDADFSEVVGDQVTVSVMGQWMGMPSADHPLLLQLSQDHVPVQELLPTPTQLAKADAAAQGLREYFSALIAERRRRPGTDAISEWLRTWDTMEPDQEAADEAVLHLAIFMWVGADTTSALLPAMIWLLDQHPDQWRWLRENPQHAPQAIEEVLRYDPPLHIIGRCAPTDMELAGVRIPKDGMAHVMVGCANLDPRQTPHGELFDIRRPGQQVSPHLAFGGGAHYCLGASMARMEAELLLTGLAERLPGLRVTQAPRWETPRVGFRKMLGMRVGL